MEAVVYNGRGQVTAATVDAPRPDAGEVLVAVRASGTCRDIDALRERFGAGGSPFIPGDEFAGEVIELGDGVDGISVGDRVVVDPNIACGECRSCRNGYRNLCSRLEIYGVTRNGGLAEFAAVRAANVVPIGGLPYDVAALAAPAGCVLNGLSLVAPGGRDTAMIFGAGPIGLLIALALRRHGLPSIAMVDVSEERLERVESFGFRGVPVDSASLAVMRRGADIVIDATGDPAVAGRLVDHAADGGRVLFFGICPPEYRIEISPFELFRRQITLSGARSMNHNLPEAIEAIRAYGADAARIVSHRLPLGEIAAILSGRRLKNSLKIQAAIG